MSAVHNSLPMQAPSLLREQCYIDGAWCDADDGGSLAVTNPATGDVIATVPNMGAQETRRAIAAADRAWPAWRRKTAKERAAILRRWFDLILRHQDDLARLMTAEQGKPLAEARAEILYAASYLEWFAEEAKRVYGDTIPAALPDRRIVVLKQPIGVCAAITPWNFPAAMITRKVGPALAAGCPIVLKPASATPFSALALAALAHDAGVPKGVFSVVTGSAARIGGEMTTNPVVRKLSFTGSTEVGKVLLQQCAASVKRTSMELGGNAPFIVFADADLDAAADGAIASKFRNTGQTCICANRIFVHDRVYEAFVEKLAERVAKLVVGDGAEPGVQVGPLIDGAAVRKVQEHIDDALSGGARLVCGGKPHRLGKLFFEPTVLADVDTTMRITHEETFGPIAPLYRFRTEAEVVRLANDTPYGLAAYFYSRDNSRIWRVSEALEYGMVGVNTGLISTEVAPFGGVKESGMGREGSKYGIDDYLEIKQVSVGIEEFEDQAA